jgi:predicted enzyme related to lactoylglutathione lyase
MTAKIIPTVVHLGIQVTDMEVSARFYQELLGLAKVPIMQGSLGPMGFIVCGGFELVLHQIPGEVVSPRNKLDHFGIQVEDLEESYKKAVAMNAARSEIHDSFQWRQFNAIDPDKYPFHLMALRRDA